MVKYLLTNKQRLNYLFDVYKIGQMGTGKQNTITAVEQSPIASANLHSEIYKSSVHSRTSLN
jgi:hypothetical protein